MRPFERHPTLHLIDNLFDHPDRRWMRDAWAEIAAAARDDARLHIVDVPDPATLKGAMRRVAVIHDPERGSIITAYEA